MGSPKLSSMCGSGFAYPSRSGRLRRNRPTALRSQPIRFAVAYDRAADEMAAQNARWRSGKPGEQLVAGANRLHRIGVDGRTPVEVHHLAWMVCNVADEQGVLAPRPDVDAEVAGRVTGRRDQAELVANMMAGVDEVDQARVGDRPDRVIEDRGDRGSANVFPIVEFDASHQITGVAERRNPAAVGKNRVPAHMIDVEVRAKHRVDGVGWATGCGEILQKRSFASVPDRLRAVLLAIADTGIDDDPSGRRFDQERMDGHPDPSLLVGKVRAQPLKLPKRRGRCLR